MRTTVAAILLVLLAVLTACTAGLSDEWAGLGDPVADPHEPVPGEPFDRPPDTVDDIARELAGQVALSGGQAKPAAVGCSSVIIVERFTCAVTYLDRTVTYTVTTTPDRSTLAGRSYNWRAEPDALVATASGIHAKLWRDYAARASDIRCEWIPAVQLVTPNQPLTEHCWIKPIVEDPQYGRDSTNRTRTVQVEIALVPGAIRFRLLSQDETR